MEQIRNAAVILILILAIIFAGSGDYQHEQNEKSRYCEMVSVGMWPEFDKNVECE